MSEGIPEQEKRYNSLILKGLRRLKGFRSLGNDAAARVLIIGYELIKYILKLNI